MPGFRMNQAGTSETGRDVLCRTLDNHHKEIYIFEIVTFFYASLLAASALYCKWNVLQEWHESLPDDVLERMMDNRTGLESRTLRGHSGPVYSTSYSPDKNYLTSASEDGTSMWIETKYAYQHLDVYLPFAKLKHK